MSASESPSNLPHYELEAGWADMSAVPDAAMAWAHSGLVATSDGELIGFHAGQLVAFDKAGDVHRVVRPGLTEGHGITLVREADQEYLWISDPGFVFSTTLDEGDEEFAALFGRGLHLDIREGRVVKMTLHGEIVAELPAPPSNPAYQSGPMGTYCPCATAVDEVRFGGSGDIWVADGYGTSLVHRFDGTGHYLSTLSGEEGAGRFACAHGVVIDRRLGKDPELYIADRHNQRVQVYDLQGAYRRTFGDDFLDSPSAFAHWQDFLVIAELYGRLAVLDQDDALVGYIGADPDGPKQQDWPTKPGWPNDLTENGRAQPPQLQHPHRFNSPHSLAVDADGALHISEWVIGGRYTRLTITP